MRHRRPWRKARTKAAGYNPQKMAVKLGSPATLMALVLTKLDEHYGGAAGYLKANGLPVEALERLRTELVAR